MWVVSRAGLIHRSTVYHFADGECCVVWERENSELSDSNQSRSWSKGGLSELDVLVVVLDPSIELSLEYFDFRTV